MNAQFILFSVLIVICGSQRSPYAGRRPIGFPAIETTTSASDPLGNRFDTIQNATTQRLPVEALGDRDLVNRLGQLPQDKQPFWFINWQALEQHRQKPQSYPQRPSVFLPDPIIPVQQITTSQGPAPTSQGPAQTSQVFAQTDQVLARNNQGLVQTTQVSSETNQGSARTNQGPLQTTQVFAQTNQEFVQANQDFEEIN